MKKMSLRPLISFRAESLLFYIYSLNDSKRNLHVM
jgi:hypothetical protein